MTIWTPERKAEFRRLWAIRPKIPTSEICRRLGVNINQLVGARRRLGLEPRNNPVKRGSATAKAVPGLPGLPGLPGVQDASVPPYAGSTAPSAPVKPGCQWPGGGPTHWDGTMCGEPITKDQPEGRVIPYCGFHMKQAYIRRPYKPDERKGYHRAEPFAA